MECASDAPEGGSCGSSDAAREPSRARALSGLGLGDPRVIEVGADRGSECRDHADDGLLPAGVEILLVLAQEHRQHPIFAHADARRVRGPIITTPPMAFTSATVDGPFALLRYPLHE